MSNVFTASVNNQKQFILPVTNLLPQNGNFLANSSSPQTWSSIIIPNAIKNNNYDYISFSSMSTSITGEPPVCVVNLEYELPAVMANRLFVIGVTDSILFANGRYKVEIRPRNGELLPIDIKCLYSISRPTTVYNSYAQVTNITLWKSFFTSDDNNKNTFLQDNLLYQGVNLNTAP